VLGGNGSDTITGGKDDDVVAGDNGRATFDIVGGVSLLREITTIAPTIGESDIIDVAGGNNVVIGGLGTDYINVGETTLLPTGDASGNDVIVGDNGKAIFATGTGASVLTFITTATADPAVDPELGAPNLGDKDYIFAGNGSNTVLGGYGADVITGGQGRDVVVGDNGSATYTVTGVLTFITISDPSIGGGDTINLGDGLNVILGGIGADTITGGNGRDIVVGDNGNATFDSTGVMTLVQTSFAILAGSYDDIIRLGSGNNVVFGGNGGDAITTTTDDDQILGDNGKATFDSSAGNSIIRDLISTDTAIGGDDTIIAGEGDNVILGGFGKDSISSGDGNDIVTGDNGHAVFNSSGILTSITTLIPEIGDVDTIHVGNGINVVLGGNGNDSITSGSGNDVIVGDNGNATFTDAGVLTFVTTSDAAVIGFYNDVIVAGDGINLVLGGNGNDSIASGSGNDVIVGDNGNVRFTDAGVLTFVITTDPTRSGDDKIFAGSGNDLIFGGEGNDDINGGDGQDIIIGDQGGHAFDSLNPGGITLIDEIMGGNDTIKGGEGNDLILGGGGADLLDGDGGQDVIFAGYGNDFAYGGNGNDIVVGGRGSDYLYGGFGNDTLYVDVFDAWSGGMLEDTIVGGPFFSTGLTFNGTEINHFGTSKKASGFGAFENLRLHQNRMDPVVGKIRKINYSYITPSSIIGSRIPAAILDDRYTQGRWGDIDSTSARTRRERGAPQLIGIGNYIEQQLSEIVLLAN